MALLCRKLVPFSWHCLFFFCYRYGHYGSTEPECRPINNGNLTLLAQNSSTRGASALLRLWKWFVSLAVWHAWWPIGGWDDPVKRQKHDSYRDSELPDYFFLAYGVLASYLQCSWTVPFQSTYVWVFECSSFEKDARAKALADMLTFCVQGMISSQRTAWPSHHMPAAWNGTLQKHTIWKASIHASFGWLDFGGSFHVLLLPNAHVLFSR